MTEWKLVSDVKELTNPQTGVNEHIRVYEREYRRKTWRRVCVVEKDGTERIMAELPCVVTNK